MQHPCSIFTVLRTADTLSLPTKMQLAKLSAAKCSYMPFQLAFSVRETGRSNKLLCLGAQIIGEPDTAVKGVLDEFGVYLKSSSFGADVKVLLKEACEQVFGTATGLVDMIVAHVPSSKAGSATKVRPHG